MSLHDIYMRARYRIRNQLGNWPPIYFPIAAWQHRKLPAPVEVTSDTIDPDVRRPVGRDTELVIEGFPRTVNTFATAAFKLAQGRPVRVAHHIHLPAQIVRAARWGIPTIILIREPMATAVSLLTWLPFLTPVEALHYYAHFYEKIEGYFGHYVVAPFEQTTTDFGSVIRAANRRFGTNFVEFEHTEANVKVVFDLIERTDRARGSGKLTVPAGAVWRLPDAEHDAPVRKRALAELDSPRVRPALDAAQRVYARFRGSVTEMVND